MFNAVSYLKDKILPSYPRTAHLPWKPNAADGDRVAWEPEANVIFRTDLDVFYEEKIDGASAGMAKYEDQPLIRNRDHILKKGYVKDTPAKKQFASIWNWYYKNEDKFDKLNDLTGGVSVYGEWMVAQHGMEYDSLPSYFIAYDIFDYVKGYFIDTGKTRELLTKAGFDTVPLLAKNVDNFKDIVKLTRTNSNFSSSEKVEGVYVKVCDGKQITNRFKMIRAGFVQGEKWDKNKLNKNKLNI